MGFKSIFKISNHVWIKSGIYSFKFDKNYYKRKSFSEGKPNRKFREYLMPWQVLPIYTAPPIEGLGEMEKKLLENPVCIFIRPNGKDTDERIKILLDIEKMFLTTFNNADRILLFLTEVKKIIFHGISSKFSVELDKSQWCISNLGNFNIPNNIKEELIIESRKPDSNIPAKYGMMSSTEITFATKKNKEEIKETDDAKIFAYLPTDWNLGFDFLVNGNFIPDGSREELFHDIQWNLYLMEEAGKLFIKWISDMIKEFENPSPYKILPDLDHIIDTENNDKKKVFLERFKIGMQEGIREIPFVLDSNNEICLLNNIIIDKTGISTIVGELVFKKQFNISKNIFQKDIKKKKWFYNQIEGAKGEIFDWDTLKEDISKLNSILKDPSTNIKFINFLLESEKMDYFNDVDFVLTANGSLQRPSNVYIKIKEDDLLFINKLDIQQLNTKVKEGLLGNYEEYFNNYDGYEFIKEQIISKIDCTNEMVTNIEESKELFNHLFKYLNHLHPNDLNSLKSLNIYNQEQEVIKINVGDSYIYNPSLQKLIDKNCFPDRHFEVISNQYPEATYTLLQKLNVRMYQPVEFIQHEICQYVDKINEHLNPLDADIKLKATQHLIELIITHKPEFSENVTKDIFNSYKELKVVTKDNEFNPVSRCFLSNEYTGNKEIEVLMEDFPEKSISFISPSYLNSSIDKREWKKTLQELKCSDDHLSFIKKELLPSLHVFDENQIINATKLIFRRQKSLEKELTSLNYFPVLTNSGIIDIYKDQVYLGKEYYIGLDSDIENLIKNCLSDNIVSNKYTLKEYEDWKKFWILIGACSKQENYQIIDDCFKYLNDKEIAINIEFDSILSWMKAHPNLSESHLPTYIQNNLVTPNLNNELCYSHELFDHSLNDIIQDDDRVCSIDLSDDTQIIDVLGLKTEIDIETYVLILKREETISWLNKNNIVSGIHELLTEQNESLPEDFIANGKVMNQRKEWVLISGLFCIEEEFSENLGIKTSQYIIHKDFNKLSSELGVVELSDEDFEFNPIGAEQNIQLKNTLLERMKYISFIKDIELCDEIEADLKEKIKLITFNKCKKISFQYDDIKKNDYPFWADEDEETLYYIGNWKEFSAAKMFDWIFDYLELSGDGIRRAFERILLAHSSDEIVEYLEENGYNIPKEWTINEGLKEDEAEETAEEPEAEETAEEPEAEETAEELEVEETAEGPEETAEEPEETTVEEASLAEDEYDKTISDEEAEAFKMLFGNEVPQECFKDLNLAACVSALIEMNKLGYDVTEAEQSLSDTNEYAQIEPVIIDGDPFKLMCRSAKGGILYLRASSWNRLDQDDINLYVKTGKGEGQYNLFKNKNDVLEVSDTNYQVFRVEADSDSSNTDNIIKGQFDNDKIWMILKMKERQEYKPIFEGSDYNENNPLW
jgi:hypothetical protein